MTERNLPPNSPIETDNASNITAATEELGTSLHVGCLAQTLSLACGKALKTSSESSPGQNETSCWLFSQECCCS